MSSPTTDPTTAPETTSQPIAAADLKQITLPVQGMTCSSCANRIEKKLNRMDGVTATVNYATEAAYVQYPADLDPSDLVATVERTGYQAQLPELAKPQTRGHDASAAAHEGADPLADNPHSHHDLDAAVLRQRLIISAALTIPVMAMAMVPALQFNNWQWLSLALASPVVIWGAWPFHRATWVNAKHGATTMDTLVSLGVTAAYLWSLYALFFTHAGTTGMTMSDMSAHGGAEIYFEVASAVTTFLLAGRYAEAKAKRNSGAALRALLDLGAKEVTVLRPGTDGLVEVRIPIESLMAGEHFIVRPGEKIATDGVVLEGRSAVDSALLTGESLPVDVGPGDEVTGATLNTSGRLTVRATRVGEQTKLAQIGRLVTMAQTGKAPVQRLADRVSAIFVPIVLVLAAATFIAWLAITHDVTNAFTAAVAVLIIACPCALGLATPTALLVGTGRGAQLGILIKGPEVLEQTRRADVIVLDKTGTVTSGAMSLASHTGDEALRLAGAVEAASEHPVAHAIAHAASTFLNEALPTVTDFVNIQGRGVQGIVDDHEVFVGRPEWVEDNGFTLTESTTTAFENAQNDGNTAVVVAWRTLGAGTHQAADQAASQGVLAVADTIKPSSRQAIAELRALGLTPMLLTGDNSVVAKAVAAQVGIDPDDVIAGVLPEGKVDVVKALQAQGKVVAMVGDGVNDAAALAQADLGMAMGTGTDVAIEASDITLVRADLQAAVDAVRLSRRTLGTIKSNLFWAFAYNVAAIPLAALGLLNPMIAGAAMAFSSVFVVTNSLRLRRFQPAATS